MTQANGVSRRRFLSGALASAATAVAVPEIAGRIIDGRVELEAHPQESSLTKAMRKQRVSEVNVQTMRRAIVTGQSVTTKIHHEDGSSIAHCNLAINGNIESVENEDYSLSVRLKSQERNSGDFNVVITTSNENRIAEIRLIDESIVIPESSSPDYEEMLARKFTSLYGPASSPYSTTALPHDFTVDIVHLEDSVDVAISWSERFYGDRQEDGLQTTPHHVQVSLPMADLQEIAVESSAARAELSYDQMSLYTMDRLTKASLEVVVNECTSTRLVNAPGSGNISVQVVRPGYLNVHQLLIQSSSGDKPEIFEDFLFIEPSTGYVQLFDDSFLEPVLGTDRLGMPTSPSTVEISDLQPNVFNQTLQVPFGVRMEHGTYRGLRALSGSVGIVEYPSFSDTAQFVWLQPNLRALTEYDARDVGAYVATHNARADSYHEITDEYDEAPRFHTPNDMMIKLGQMNAVSLVFSQSSADGSFDRHLTVAGSEVLRGTVNVPDDFDLTQSVSLTIYDDSRSSVFVEHIPYLEREYPTVELLTPTVCDPVRSIV